jgi:general L-amino acid transport system permease protein
VPVYLQLLIWYLLFAEALPDLDGAWNAGHFYLSKNGISFPWPVWQLGQTLALGGAGLGLVFGLYYRRLARAHFDRTGQPRPVLWVASGRYPGLVGVGLAGWGCPFGVGFAQGG